jgi:HIV Tat-specific factor 1
VILFDKEADGVASVRFSDPETAVACVQVCSSISIFSGTIVGSNIFAKMMDGRFFAGTRVEAYVADGSEKFKKTNEKQAALLSSVTEGEADEESARLDKFGSWLESESGSKEESAPEMKTGST